MQLTTRDDIMERLASYLHHRMTLAQLVDWAEQVMLGGDFAAGEHAGLREVVARLGVADVRAFGLTWEECEALVGRLGYRAEVTLCPATEQETRIENAKR